MKITANAGGKRLPGREYYLDGIRNLVVLILVPFHSGVTFSHIGKGYVYTALPDDSLFFVFISDFFNLWIMRALFFVSGIALFLSMGRRSAGEIVKDRFGRLILPVLFHLLTLGPAAGFILAKSRYGFQGGFLSFYPLFFVQARQYLFWGHMWYCVYLFLLSLACLPLFSYLHRRPEIVQGINRFLQGGAAFLIPLLLIALLEALLRPFYPGYQSFWGDWANVAVYLFFLILGFIAGQSQELLDGIMNRRIPYLLAALLLSAIYLTGKEHFFKVPTYGQLAALSFLWGMAAFTWVFALIGLFRKHLRGNSAILSYLSETSFSLYLFHYYIVSLLNFLLLKTGWGNRRVWLFSTLGTYALFALLFEYVIRRSRLLRSLCGIKKRQAC